MSDLLLSTRGDVNTLEEIGMKSNNDINFAPKILTAEEFAAEIGNDNDEDEDNDVMFMSMQDFKKKLDMMSGMQ